jgi:quinol monooxygenase YgiN
LRLPRRFGSLPAAMIVERRATYGLIGRMLAKPGEREALIGHILGSSAAMPGCLSYVVARSPRVRSDAVTVIYFIIIASEFSEKWIPLFGPML